MARKDGRKVVAVNRRARHDYFVEETIEAGIVLQGTEVKALRDGRANLRDAYGQVVSNEVYLFNMHIGQYEQGSRFNHEPLRPRKLLLRKSEIRYLIGKTREPGYTLVPLSVYFRGGWAKVELGIAKGKRKYDKRESIARREDQRRIERVLKDRTRGR